MKKIFVILALLLDFALVWAQTPQAIWTEGNKTITFYYGNLYEVGDIFDGQTVTKVWSGERFHEIRRTDDPTIVELVPGWVTDESLINKTDRSFVCSDFPEKIETAFFDPSFKNYRLSHSQYFFCGCQNLKTIIGIENLNTEKINNMTGMFCMCYSLPSIDLSHFNTANVTDMCSMFSFCTNFKELDVSTFNTRKVRDMSFMFEGCSGLTSLDISNFDTRNVVDMYGMFTNSNSLKILDLQKLNIQSVTDVSSMFEGCSELEKIYCLSDWRQIRYNIAGTDMFNGCDKLVGAVEYNASKTNAMMANPQTGYFTGDKITIEKYEFDYGLTWADAQLFPKEFRFDVQQSGNFTYIVDYENVTNVISDAGKHKVTIRFVSDDNSINYSQGFEVTINPIDISNGKIDDIPAETFDANFFTPSVTITHNGNKLVQNQDFVTSYNDNYHVGTATVIINGKGNYYGKLETQFDIEPRDISETDISTIHDQDYIGSEITPEVSVTYKTVTLVSGVDYDVEYSDNIEVGTASVKFLGKGDFCNEVTRTFSIVKKEPEPEPEPQVEPEPEPEPQVECMNLKTKWDDVVYVPNPDSKYVSYRWFRNDEEIPGAKKQFFNELGGLDGVYYAIITDIDGHKIQTCPLEKTKKINNSAPRVNVFPNPAVAGETITIQLENMDISKGVELMIYSSSGSFVMRIQDVQHTNYLTLPKGGYMGYAMYEGKNVVFKIMVEK